MNFVTDQQTLDDLNIPGKYRPGSVFSLFNRVVTVGGERRLEAIFRQPLTDYIEINQRAETMKYFMDHPLQFSFTKEDFRVAEEYLEAGSGNTRLGTAARLFWKKITSSFLLDKEYKPLHDQLLVTIRLLDRLATFISGMPPGRQENDFFRRLNEINIIFNKGPLKWIGKMKQRERLTVRETANYDHRLRVVFSREIRDILHFVYELDVYIAVGSVARLHKFSFANMLPREKNFLSALDLKHPCLAGAVGNDISMTTDRHIVFLTGANMAGKSTFMKSLGIAIYLSHIGFPVAAKNFSLSVKDGIYTSINVSDDLGLGYSHFFSEVMRVKKIALEISRPLSLYVIFDELFKGTNVKDAFEATLEITKALTEKSNCFFVISTHITEAGRHLQNMTDSLLFVYFPSFVHNDRMKYTYKLESGISDDRHGMMILKKEGIRELITGQNT